MSDRRQPTALLARMGQRMDELFSTSDYFQLSSALDALNEAQEAIHAEIAALDVGWFLSEAVFTTVAGRSDYPIPADCRTIKRICPLGGAGYRELPLVYEIYPALQHDEIERGVVLFDNSIRIYPTPTAAFNISLQYARKSAPMHYGTLAAADLDTCTLDASPTVGNVSLLDDFYNGSMILTTGGTGSGQIRLIYSYDGDTRVCTLATDWSTQPDATTTYEILSGLDENETETLILGAMAHLMADDTDLEAWKQHFGELYAAGMRRLIQGRARRQTSNNLKWNIKR